MKLSLCSEPGGRELSESGVLALLHETPLVVDEEVAFSLSVSSVFLL